MPSKLTKLETAIVDEFVPRFVPDARPIFQGVGSKRPARFDKSILTLLGILVLEQESFPDVILYESKKKWLFLIEPVVVKNYISSQRRSELEKLFKKCRAGKVYITAFWEFADYAKCADKIAWDTEVWIAEMPSHMIHMNGDQFLGPR